MLVQERQLPRSSSQAGEDATSVEFRHIHHDDGADHAVCAGAFAVDAGENRVSLMPGTCLCSATLLN